MIDEDEIEDDSRTLGSLTAGGDGWGTFYVQLKGEDGVWEDIAVEIPGDEDGLADDADEQREEDMSRKRVDKGKGRAM